MRKHLEGFSFCVFKKSYQKRRHLNLWNALTPSGMHRLF
ncbi:hypothetical protein [Enterococcus phage PEF7b]